VASVAVAQCLGGCIFFLLVGLPQGFQSSLYYYHKDVFHLDDQSIGYLISVSGIGGVLAALIYKFLCRGMQMRELLTIGVICFALSTLVYVFYQSIPAAIAIQALSGILNNLGFLALVQAAVLVTPGGSAAVGFALLMSALNIGVALGDLLAAKLVDKFWFSLSGVFWTYAGAATLLIFAIGKLPQGLLTHREITDEAAITNDGA
jgi:predicted MFS family arabinose efflux permease